jgi:hypothetical protein
MARATKTQKPIPRKVYRYTQLILMPRYGVKNVVSKAREVTLAHVCFVDGPLPAAAGAA